jgi:hypothetical protein
MKIVLALAAVLALAGCGDRTGTPPGATDATSPVASPTAVPSATDPLTTPWPVTVLDDGDGAELCLGGVADSLPPQCSGPPLAGWDWSEYDGDYEQRSGVRWGEFVVTGTFDGTAITPTDVVAAADVEPPDDPVVGSEFETPCPEPAGGWVAVDPTKAGQADMDRAFARASRLDGYAASFVDTSRDERSFEEMDRDAAAGHDDVSTWIVNVRVVGDAGAAQDAIREVWGGPLCVVSGGDHTDAELGRIQEALTDVPGFSGSGRDTSGVVEVAVVYDDGTLQRWADEEYGRGVVQVSSALVPAE